MSTFKEIVYLALEELKLTSDDSYYTEDHILFLLNKYRAFLLKQRYSDIKKQMPESNYQTIGLTLASATVSSTTYLKSSTTIPYLMQIGNPRVYSTDYYKGDIALVSRDRMRYVGNNRFLQKIVYCSIHPDSYMYFISATSSVLTLTSANITAIFQDCIQAANQQDSTSDIMDKTFPIEEALISPLVELVMKEILGVKYIPKDDENNASDDMSNVQIKK